MAQSSSLLRVMCVIATTLGVVCPAANAQFHQPLLLHVDDDAAPGGDGASWATAYNDLQMALDYIRAHPDPDGHLIRIAEGTYRPFAFGQPSRAFAIPSHTTILGGHLPVWGNPRDPVGTPTIIMGDIKGDDTPEGANTSDNANTVIGCWDEASLPTIVLTADVVLDGLTIEGAGVGGNVSVVAGVRTSVRSCVVRFNSGVFEAQPDTVITDCTFRDNRNTAVHVVSKKDAQNKPFGGEFIVERCAFHRNTPKTYQASALHITGLSLHATDCAITDQPSAFVSVTPLISLRDEAPSPSAPFNYEHRFTRCAFAQLALPALSYLPLSAPQTQVAVFTDCSLTDLAGGMTRDALGAIECSGTTFRRIAGAWAVYYPSRFAGCSFEKVGPVTIAPVFDPGGPFNSSRFEGCSFLDCQMTALRTAEARACVFATTPTGSGTAMHGEDLTMEGCTIGVRNPDSFAMGTGFAGLVSAPKLRLIGCDFVGCDAAVVVGNWSTTPDAGNFLRIDSCRFERNTFVRGIYNGVINPGTGSSSAVPTTIVNTLFADNMPGTDRAVVASSGPALRIADSTLVNNGATVVSDGATREIQNCIVWGNRDGTASPIQDQQLSAFAASPATIASCIIEGWTGSIAGVDTTGNDPVFIDPIGADGTPGTGDENYRPAPVSPAIDGGNNALLPADASDVDGDADVSEPVPFDLDGNLRILSAQPGGVNPTVDIGAYEYQADCNDNGVADADEIQADLSKDCNGNLVLDECEPDCDGDGMPDACTIDLGFDEDCNGNGIPDACDILVNGTSLDRNGNGVPDECDPDCNGNGIPDDYDIDVAGTSTDCNLDGIPDECRAEVEYAVDDGQPYPNRNLALVNASPEAHSSTLMLTQQTVVPGGETIHEVEFYAGAANEGKVFIVVYDDPNNDGDPSDAAMIGAYPVRHAWVGFAGNAGYRSQSIPPTQVGAAGDSFFVGVWFTQSSQMSFAGFVRSVCASDRCFLLSAWPADHLPSLAGSGIVSLAYTEAHYPTFWNCSRPPGGSPTGGIAMHIRARTLRAYDCDLDDRPDACDAFADLNDNGVPDSCECPGDVNGDGRVDVTDFLMLANGYGRTDAFWFDGDVTGDGAVGIADFCIVATTYGQVCRESPVPARSGGAVETFIWPAAMESPVDR